MQVYLVGGAVRDQLLGLPIKDKDFMVAGGDVDTLKRLGFLQVGADFPVFLHPKTQNEYALARTERKAGSGHTGFVVHSAPTVSAREDLARRDLTINALAIEVRGLFDDTPVSGEVVDFYGGVADLHDKILRHISPAFSEDPLRVLRVARFFARFSPLGFYIHPDTVQLMQQIAQSGELSLLSRERIWSETARALGERCGQAYIECLHQLQILPKILPELSNTWQNKALHRQSIDALTAACADAADLPIKTALLLAALPDKAAFDDCAHRLNLPKNIRQLALLFLQNKDDLANFQCLSAERLVRLIELTKAHKNAATLHALLTASGYWADNQQKHDDFIDKICNTFNSIGIADIDPSLKGAAIAAALHEKRVAGVGKLLDAKSSSV